MRRIVAKIIFSIIGWKVVGSLRFPNKCLIIGAPHTSNWDFLIGKCYSYITGISGKYLIKSELFIPIIGSLLRWDGGIPVFRGSKNDFVETIVDKCKISDKFILAITPEGTRTRVKRWKTGFYHIAMKADVPILLLKIDYKNKEIGVFDRLFPSGDLKKDMFFIQEKYDGFEGKIPENYNPIIF